MSRLAYVSERVRQIVREASGLTGEALEAVLESIEIEPYEKGQVILAQGDLGTSSYFVVTGCVRKYLQTASGKEVSVEFYLDEAVVNTMSGLDSEGRALFSYECLEDSYLLSCEYEEIRAMETTQTPFSPMIRNFFNSEFADLAQRYAAFKAMSPEDRFLELYQTRRDLFFRVPQHLLASYLDISPETFSRYKKRFL